MDFGYIPSFSEPFAFTISLHNRLSKPPKDLAKIITAFQRNLSQLATPEFITSRIPRQTLVELLPKKRAVDSRLRFSFVKDFTPDSEFAKFTILKTFLFHCHLKDYTPNNLHKSQLLLRSQFEFGNDNSVIIFVDSAEEQTDFSASRLIVDENDNSGVIVIRNFEELNSQRNAGLFLNDFMSLLVQRLVNLPFLSPAVAHMTSAEYGKRMRERNNPEEGQILKIRGDLAMLLGSAEDALDYYQKASEFFFSQKEGLVSVTKTFNKLWIACIYEALCGFNFERIRGIRESESPNFDRKYAETKSISLINDCLKIYTERDQFWAQYCLLVRYLEFLSTTGLKKVFLDHFYLLKSHFGKPYFNYEVLYFVAEWASKIGLNRLAVGLWCELMAKLDNSQESQGIKATLSLKCISTLKLGTQRPGVIADEPHELSVVIYSFIFAKALEAKSSVALRSPQVLHFYILLLAKNPKLSWIFTNISTKVVWESPFLEMEYRNLPYVVRVAPYDYQKRFKLSVLDTKIDDDDEETNSASRIFIYDPRTASRKKALNWTAEKKHKVEVYLSNPLPFSVKLTRLVVQTVGVESSTHSTEVTLPPMCKSYPVLVKVKPLKPGLMEITSVDITIRKLGYSNALLSSGVSQIYRTINFRNPHLSGRYETQKTKEMMIIPIAESVPKIDISLLNYVPEIIHFNENLRLEYKVSNLSKRILKQVSLTVLVDFENAPSRTVKKRIESFELENGEVMFVDVFFDQSENWPQSTAQTIRNTNDQSKRREIFQFVNQNRIYRIYKITVEIEAGFSSNKQYVGFAIHEKTFKTFEFFNIFAKRVYERGGPVSLSDQVYLSIDVENREEFLQSSNVQISVLDRRTSEILATGNLAAKERYFVPVSLSELRKLKNLGEKLDVVFQTKEFNRSGIIQLDQDVEIEV